MTHAAAQSGGFQVLTSRGPAAIAVIRLHGGLAHEFLDTHVRTVRRGDSRSWQAGAVFRAALIDNDGAAIDDILVSVHAPAPAFDARLHLHGSPWLVGRCVELLRDAGLAEQREQASTLWRFRDTIEAEAYALLPEMLTLRGVEWLTRQSDLLAKMLRTLAHTADVNAAKETCRAIIERRNLVERFRRPLRVALVGPPNAGKSTLANALADRQVSVVSPQPGTTRDWVEAFGEIDGFPVTWLDTAGLREADCDLESESVRRSRRLAESADAVLLVLDATAPETWPGAIAELSNTPTCIAINKIDLRPVDSRASQRPAVRPGGRIVAVSAETRDGLDALLKALLAAKSYDEASLQEPAAFTERQVEHLSAAIAMNQDGFAAALRGRRP